MKKKTMIQLILKISISIIVLMYILTKIDLPKFFGFIKKADMALIFFALLLLIIERLVSVYKWSILLAAKRTVVSFWKLFSITYIGSFLGQFLPSSLSVDTIRSYYLSKDTSNVTESISSVLVDRVMGLLSLLSVGFIGAGYSYYYLQKKEIALGIVIFGAIFLMALLFFGKRGIIDYAERKVRFLNDHRIWKKFVEVYDSLSEYKKFPYHLLFSYALSLVVQIIRILIYYTISRSIEMQISIVYFFMFIPIIMIIIMLPISIGGLGVREGAFVSFFSHVGVSSSGAFAISLVFFVLMVITILPGGVIYLMEGVFVKSSRSKGFQR